MNLPEVAQAQALSELFGAALASVRPQSVALIGCAGGNGLEQVDRAVTSRIVAVDINTDYLAVCAARFPGVETVCADVSAGLAIGRVDLVHIALVLEFVADPGAVLEQLRPVGAAVSVVLQLASEETPAITPSPYRESLSALAPIHRLLSPADLELDENDGRIIALPGGKRLWHAIIR